MKTMPVKVIALESRLKGCNNVISLGVKPNFNDYSESDKRLIRRSKKIYYPTLFYAELFDSIGKPTFPSPQNYYCAQDKIKQTTLFNLLSIPHPRTRFFYGKRQKSVIRDYFSFPFIAKIPRGSAMGRGVFLIRNTSDLDQYLDLDTPAYIQEYIPIDRDMRIVIIGKKIAHAYWRIAPEGDFRSNIAVGATVSLDSLHQAALDLAIHTATACRWNDVGIDLCEHNGSLYVLEANMKYGKEGFRKAGIDYIRLMDKKIADGEI